MKIFVRTQNRESGVALVTTVIVIAVLAVVAVAFMQSTSMDRLSSRTVANHYRAKLVAEAGLAMAESALARAMTNDTFIVVANTNGELFVGNGIAGDTNFSYTPAFSTVANMGNDSSPIVTGGMPSANVPNGSVFTNQLPGGLSVTSPPVSWVYLTETNSAGQTVTNGRFAYWVEDLGGRMDLSVVGATNAADITNARRLTGTNPAEIALWSLFNPASSSDPGNATAASLVAARSNLLSPATARLVNSQVTTDLLPDLAVGLRHDTNEPEVIPLGFRYADEGRLKYDLNTNIASSGVNVIAAAISNNLAGFTQRAGGYTNAGGGGAANAAAFTPFSYLQTLAANIIDYADTDSNPTTDGTALSTNRARPVYRGVDSYPFVNEISKRWRMIGNAITNINGVQGRGITIETTDFFELWNPSSQTVNGSFTFVSVHRQTGQAGFLAFSFANPDWASNSIGPVVNGVTTNVFAGVSIPPNGFTVLACPTVTNFFFAPSTNTNVVRLDGETNSSYYFAGWNGIFYDALLGGIYRLAFQSAAGLQLNSPTNRANLPSFIYQNPGATGFGDPAVGDPRATIYLSRPADANRYINNTSWGGRNLRAGIAATNSYAEVSLRRWPDGGHDSPPGIAAGSQAALPTGVGGAAYSNVPPGRISNAGAFTNISELGAVFDPIQWRVPSLNAWQGKWTNLPAGGSAVADDGFGGGTTLRIGRAEHPRFTNDGLRAAQLLDLFAAGPTNGSGAVVRRAPGRININTASTNVLRALAAGVYHTSDIALTPNGTNFVVPANAVSSFVRGVTNFRAAAPFFSVNQLPSIATNNDNAQWPTNAVFGNSNIGAAGITAWNDAAAEEWFSKIHPLASVRSRNFLVHVIGQTVASNNPTTALSTHRMTSQIYFAPLRGSDGLTTNSRVELIRSWGL